MNNPEVPTGRRPHVVELRYSEEGLDTEQKKLLGIYKDVVVETGNVWDSLLKIGEQPVGFSRDELAGVTKRNPGYNFIFEVDQGSLGAMPYELLLAKPLAPILSSLSEAIEVTSDPDEKRYLEGTIGALRDGQYEDGMREWINNNPKIGLTVGYFQYKDRSRTEHALSAWVGIKDDDMTELATRIGDIYKRTYGSNVKVVNRAERSVIFGGDIADAPTIPGAGALPNEQGWRERHGTKITFFLNSTEKTNEEKLPITRSIWDEASEYTDDEFKTLGFKLLAAHENMHPATRHDNDEARLTNNFTYISETLCDVLAQKLSGDLIDQLISKKELRAAIPSIVSTALTLRRKGMPLNYPHMQGWATITNYMIENGGVEIDNRKLKLGSDEQMRSAILGLTERLEDIIRRGNNEDAKTLLEAYGDARVFDKLIN